MNKNKDMISCALDIGSSRIKAALGRYCKQKNLFEILAVKSISPSGVSGGIVSDMATCTQAVAGVLEEIELKAKAKFDYLFLTVPSSQINLECARGACLLKREGHITSKEIEHAIQSSIEFYLPLDRKLVQIIVAEFIIDGQKGILNPIGMLGKKLEVQTILLHSPVQVVSNLVTAVEEAGYSIDDLIVCPQAQAEFFLTAREKEDGAILLDVGDQTINFSYFKDKFIFEIKSFDTGIAEINKGISSFFKIPYEYARKLNERYFSLTSNIDKSNEPILLEKKNGEYESILRKDFCARGTEISGKLFAIIEKYLKRHSTADSVMLSGGAALMDGFLEKLEDYNLNLKPGMPLSGKIKVRDPSLNSSLFSNSICACVYGLKLLREKRLNRLKDRHFLSRFFLRIRDLLEEYF